MSHVCHADGCNKPIPPAMLMCFLHWKMVPKDLQRKIWATYKPGQEIRKDPTPAYMDAYRAAVEAVAVREGRINRR